MRIVGGSYGAGGKLKLDEGFLVIDGAFMKRIPVSAASSVNASQRTERNFGVISFLISAVIFCSVGAYLVGNWGIAAGMIVATALAFTKKTVFMASVHFDDGTHVDAEGWHYAVQKLVKATRK